MIEMSFKDFLELESKESYIFFFSLDGYCGLCKLQEREYLKHNIPNLIKVKADSEEQLMNMNIHVLPCTMKIGNDKTVKMLKYGVQYEKQIKEFVNASI